MIDQHEGASIDREEDQRFMLAAMAARRARRNRPRRLIALAALALAGAAVAAAWGASQRAGAVARLRGARVELLAVEQLVPQYQEASARGEQSPYAPTPDLVTRIQGYARDAGLDNPLPLAPTSAETRGAFTETTVRANNMQNRTLPPVFRWIARVVEEIPGIELTHLDIKPTPQGWTVNVTFVKPTRR